MNAGSQAAPGRSGRLPSGTISFAFTDIEGSTQRWDRYPQAMQAAVRRHDLLLRAAILAYDGYVFKTLGDAFCAAFRRPDDAIEAMLAGQRALAAHDFEAVDGLRVRAAVHTGTADERDGDYFGPVLNRVARLLALGHGGQILVSGTTAALVAGALADGVTLRDLGEHRLKDLTAREHVFEVRAADLAADHPPLRSLDAHPNNLPFTFSTFIGRDAEIAEIGALLATYRVVTIVGAGGIGKTRTSLQVAANLLDGSGDGVWFIELAPLAGDYIAAAIARELRITLAAHGDPVDGLARALRAKRALLVLDNCEHVVASAAHVVDAIVRNCPHIAILASSRQPLNIVGERTYRLPSLALPDTSPGAVTLDVAERSAAVALFVERARAVDGRFELNAANSSTVVEICRRLDGIPLAIELAAARLKILSPRQLRDRLDERFRVLTGGDRNALPRQQTLRALIDWSYDLLDEREREIFARLGVFVNGFTLEAATAIAGAADFDEFDIIDGLTSLADKSLVLAETQADALRYRMLESTRSYALERLTTTGALPVLARRHAEYFSGLATRAMKSADPAQRLTEIEAELDNLRAVIAWTLDAGHDVVLGARVADRLGYYWFTRLPHEGLRRLDAARAALERAQCADAPLVTRVAAAYASMLPHGSFERVAAVEHALRTSRTAGDPQLCARLLCAYGEQLTELGRIDDARSALREALAQARAIGSDMDAARSLAGLAQLAGDGDDIEQARRLGRETLAIFERLGASDGVAYTCLVLGNIEYRAGNADAAIELTLRGRRLNGELQNDRSSANAADNAAYFCLALGRPADAKRHARDALEVLGADRHPLYFTLAIDALALVATLTGQAQRGALLQGYSAAVFTKLAHRRTPVVQDAHDKHIELLCAALDAGELAALRARGAALADNEALREALAV